jgi:hypothetical protein
MQGHWLTPRKKLLARGKTTPKFWTLALVHVEHQRTILAQKNLKITKILHTRCVIFRYNLFVMNILSPPRPELVDKALLTSREFCAGKTIDGAPALAHAVKVTVKLGEHIPKAPPELVAATLLHDSPEFAPDELGLDELLRREFGATTLRVVRALEKEHHHLDDLEVDALDALVADMVINDPDTLHATTADKIVSFQSILRRADRSGDRAGFFAVRRPLAERMPYFRRYVDLSEGHIPNGMHTELDHYITQTEMATLAVREAMAAERA